MGSVLELVTDEEKLVSTNVIEMRVVAFLCLVGLCVAANVDRLQETQFVEEEFVTEIPPKPYNFGFEVSDDNTTNYQNRVEATGEDGVTRGSYSYVLPDGFVYTVEYLDNGDGSGLQATVRKEPSNIEVVTPSPWIDPKRTQQKQA